jgi:hypothetical protein
MGATWSSWSQVSATLALEMWVAPASRQDDKISSISTIKSTQVSIYESTSRFIRTEVDADRRVRGNGGASDSGGDAGDGAALS